MGHWDRKGGHTRAGSRCPQVHQDMVHRQGGLLLLWMAEHKLNFKQAALKMSLINMERHASDW